MSCENDPKKPEKTNPLIGTWDGINVITGEFDNIRVVFTKTDMKIFLDKTKTEPDYINQYSYNENEEYQVHIFNKDNPGVNYDYKIDYDVYSPGTYLIGINGDRLKKVK
ncbi:MAG: hypothetical protein LBH20_05305 [Treponema sp.]|jgi:hypothetical protein|nr:hypothetical protein [Treponema sp.]